jgi:peptidyl-prolyl cis-trans isomerase C
MVQRNLMFFLFLYAALCFSAPAQQTTPPATPSTQAAPATPAPQTTPETPLAPATPASQAAVTDLVVLKVSGEPISERIVLAAINGLARQRQIPPDPNQPRNVKLFQGAVDNLIITAVLKNRAKELNLAADQAKVNEQIQAISKQFPSPEEFQKALASQGTTEADLRKGIEESMKMQLVVDQAIKDTPPATDEEIQKYYNDNPKNFERQEQVHAAHILLMVDNKNGTPEQKAEARKKIEEIRADIESNKITFEGAAIKYSQDKSNASKGGDLGFFTRGRMVKPFEDAAFAAQPGILSPIVETDFGFHIIKVIEQKPAGTVSLEEAKTKIGQFLNQTSKRKATQQYVNGLKSTANIETFLTAEEFLKRHPEIK